MPSLEIKIPTLGGAWITKTIQLSQFKFYRRSNRSLLEYKNGGGESVYHGFTYFIELSWQYLSVDEHEVIMDIVDAIRGGKQVWWSNATDFNYLKLDPSAETAMYLDVVDDDVVEAFGEWVEKMPFEITFRITRAVTGVHDDA